MSFRARLTLFFVLIVIVPMLSVAIVLFRLIADNETGKADAGVRVSRDVAMNVYADARRDADKVVSGIGTDERLARALRDQDESAARARIRQLLRRPRHRPGRHPRRQRRARRGRPDGGRADRALARGRGRRALRPPAGLGHPRRGVRARRCATWPASTLAVTPERARAGHDRARGHAPTRCPRPAAPIDATIDGTDYRTVSFAEPGFAGRSVVVSVLDEDSSRQSAISRSRILAAGILVGFLVLAMTFAIAVSRSLQAPDRVVPDRGAADRRRRLLHPGHHQRPRRVRRAGRGVQQDVGAAVGAPGGPAPGARAPADLAAAHRPDVRLQPRPRRAAGDRRAHRGGRPGRARRPGQRAPGVRAAAAGDRARRRAGRARWSRCAAPSRRRWSAAAAASRRSARCTRWPIRCRAPSRAR